MAKHLISVNCKPCYGKRAKYGAEIKLKQPGVHTVNNNYWMLIVYQASTTMLI